MAKIKRDVSHIIEEHLDYKDLRNRIGPNYKITGGHELYFSHHDQRIMVSYNVHLKNIKLVITNVKSQLLKDHDAFANDTVARTKLNVEWWHKNWPPSRQWMINTGKNKNPFRPNDNKLHFRLHCTPECLYTLIVFAMGVIDKILDKDKVIVKQEKLF